MTSSKPYLEEVKGKRETYYKIYWPTGTYLGEVILEIDGMYVFYPVSQSYGAWAAHALRAIADTLDELNEPYQKQLEDM